MSNDLGQGAAFAAGGASASTQRWLRKMSTDPREPRVFSQAKILIPVGLITSLPVLLVTVAYFDLYLEGRQEIEAVIGASVITLVCLTLLVHGFWRRFGVDEEKVWTKFGCLFYREIRFDEITRLNIGVQRYKLYVGRKLVNIDYNRFDYSLVYIRLMEELARRRFDLPEAKVDDPNWEEQCQLWKDAFRQRLCADHAAYYEQHPEELVKLQQLAQTPPAPKQCWK